MRGDNVRVTHGEMEGGSRAEQQQINRQAEQSASTDLSPFQTRELHAVSRSISGISDIFWEVNLLKRLVKLIDRVPIGFMRICLFIYFLSFKHSYVVPERKHCGLNASYSSNRATLHDVFTIKTRVRLIQQHTHTHAHRHLTMSKCIMPIYLYLSLALSHMEL